MVDRAFRLLVRNYWSIFFVVAAVTVPLQIAYATIWHDVIAVSDLHADIEEFPPLRQVQGVGRTQLDQARLAYWVLWAVEIALIPLFLRATRRVLETDARGGVASALDGWRAALTRRAGGGLRLGRPAAVVAGAAAATLVFVLLGGIGSLVVEPLADGYAFAGVGLAEGVARAAAAPFLLVTALRSEPAGGLATARE
jgi:hypothetical protein